MEVLEITNDTGWSSLNRDLIVMIMCYITRKERYICRVVCKSWYRAYWYGVNNSKYPAIRVQDKIIRVPSRGKQCCGTTLLCVSRTMYCCIPVFGNCLGAAFGCCSDSLLDDPTKSARVVEITENGEIIKMDD